MTPEDLQALSDRGLIRQDQVEKISPILSRKIISVFYELRIILYLGVMLFTTGVGILIYQNIGQIGHIVLITLLFLLTAVCFVYAFRKALPYAHTLQESSVPFLDYIVLLGCLLFISVLGYLQFQYALFDDGMGATTLVTAVFFFYVAYRFDHLGVLSLAITALASFWSISVSPMKWYSGEFVERSNLHNVALAFGAGLSAIAMVLDKNKIKQHFTFTYINFSMLIFLTGASAGIMINDPSYAVDLICLYAGSAFCVYFAHQKKSFLFLLYAFIYGYFGTTYVLTDLILNDAGLWFFYLFLSCGGFIYFISQFKDYFKRAK